MDISNMELPEEILSMANGMLLPGETLPVGFDDLCKRVKKRTDRVQGGKILYPETVALMIELTKTKPTKKSIPGPKR